MRKSRTKLRKNPLRGGVEAGECQRKSKRVM